MIDNGFAMLDVGIDDMGDFMKARVGEYLADAKEAGLIE